MLPRQAADALNADATDRAVELLATLDALSADPITISCALMHVALQGGSDLSAIEKGLGVPVKRQLADLEKLKQYESGQSLSGTERSAEGLRRLLLALVKDVRVVLINTTHPGNIGGTARAMKVMGLSQLHLVSPKTWPSADATALASGAAFLWEALRLARRWRPAARRFSVRLGSQVINWGEATFTSGINGLQNRADLIARNTPGVEVKEILLTTWALYGQIDVIHNVMF